MLCNKANIWSVSSRHAPRHAYALVLYNQTPWTLPGEVHLIKRMPGAPRHTFFVRQWALEKACLVEFLNILFYFLLFSFDTPLLIRKG